MDPCSYPAPHPQVKEDHDTGPWFQISQSPWLGSHLCRAGCTDDAGEGSQLEIRDGASRTSSTPPYPPVCPGGKWDPRMEAGSADPFSLPATVCPFNSCHAHRPGGRCAASDPPEDKGPRQDTSTHPRNTPLAPASVSFQTAVSGVAWQPRCSRHSLAPYPPARVSAPVDIWSTSCPESILPCRSPQA